jgi:DNA gyrase subunit A
MQTQQNGITEILLEDSLKTSYLDYSMSVIIGRALPDVRDGLKPVHRRILFAMKELGITSRTPYKKSARIVGDTIGKYHPHGDTSVYDALVRMAQDFSMREPLVDGQGNFGSIDGDSAAAMRYTEVRISHISEYLTNDIDKDTVDFRPTYDDSGREPEVLPAAFPNLLLNGSEGIAVGMATKIPPHNLRELSDALVHLIDNPEANVDDLLAFIEGPDFPTGGTIFGKEGIRDAYRTGRGKLKIRAKTHIEENGSRENIIIDELPYQVNKAKLIEKIAELSKTKDLSGISNIRDESDKDGIRVVIELKRDTMSEIVLNNLYKSTLLQVSFGIILLAVHEKEPKVFTLLEILSTFLRYRKTIIVRRVIFDLTKAKARAHILEGLKIALDDIDKIIELIKKSDSKTDAIEKLTDKYKLSNIQSNAILEMKLQRLTGLEREKILEELKSLKEEIEYLESILKSEDKLNDIIKEEILDLKEKFGEDRRTDIEENFDAIEMEDLIPNEDMVVSITHKGYVKRVNAKTYENQHRGGKGKIAVTTDDDDFIERFFVSKTHDTLLCLTDLGQLYWLKVYRIPEASRTSKGKNIVNLISLKDKEKVVAIINTTDFSEDKSLIFFTKKGIAKRTNLSEFSNIRSNGVRAIIINEEDALVNAKIADEKTKNVMIFTHFSQCIQFPLEDLREQGRGTKGVFGIKFKKDKDYVMDADVISSGEEEIFTISENGIGKRSSANLYRLQNRGGKGVIAMKMTPRTGKSLAGAILVKENMDLMVLTISGKLIRVDMQSISKLSKNTSGVQVIKGDKVSSISQCPKNIEELSESDV